MTRRNDCIFTTIPGLDGVTLVHHSGRIPTRARHMHHSLCLGAVMSGSRTLVCGDSTCEIATGEVIALVPGQVHTCPDAGESEYVMISIAPECFDRLGISPLHLAVSSPRVDDPVLFRLILRLADLAEHPASTLERETALLEMLLAFQSARVDRFPEEPVSRQVRPVREYIREHCAEDIRLEFLARLVGLSPCRLNRAFAAEVGMPPHEYQSQLRIREVKRLIAEGSPLADAAVQAGFSDQSHMTRCFRKITGMTPGRYARGLGRKHSH